MDYKGIFKKAMLSEANAILKNIDKVDYFSLEKVVSIFNALRNTGGNLVFVGVGKSGFTARKLAATFSSLGLPSFFLHPTEALHGDLGTVSKNSALVIISKSGTTEEILKLCPFIPVSKQMIIGLLGNINSPLAKHCEVVLDCSVSEEACINNQAPTTSSTLTMAIGDGLAVLYENLVGLSKEKFAVNHPGGILGKTLRLQVADLMIGKEHCAVVSEDNTFQDLIIKMTEIPVGMCAILGSSDSLEGIVAEGDIRRIFLSKKSYLGEGHILHAEVKAVMNSNPVTISSNELAYRALELMEMRKRQISVLPVVDNRQFKGVIRLHDLLREGFKKD